MPPTRPLKVFLCHASADKPAVRKLYHYLRERKMDPWLDAEKLLPGQNWQVEIPKALLSSDVIIICLSKNSVDKEGYVQKEIKFALDKALEMPEGRIFLIPARLEECDLPYSLSTYHYVNLFEADGYKRLLRSLRVRAEQIGATKISVNQDTIPPKIIQPDIFESQKDNSIGVGGNVSDANIIVGNNNVIQVMPKSEPVNRVDDPTHEAKGATPEKTKQESVQKTDQELILEALHEPTKKFAPHKKEQEENTEKIVRLKAARENAERIAREKAERETAQKKPAEKPALPKAGPIAPKQTKQGQSANKPFPIWLGGLGLILIAVVGFIIATNWHPSTPIPAETATFTASPISTETLTPEPTITPTPTLGIDSTMTGSDGMTLVYVPEGEFTMGVGLFAHKVKLDAFWIDQTEVTNKQYIACVSANKCNPPSSTRSATRSSYYGNAEFDDYPIIYALWDNATAYCSWVGRRLPTEAEWEKATRGTDGRIYPWGIDTPNKDLLNYDHNVGDTTKVGSYPLGKSFYGAYDMAGNVWEWVSDWYSEYYYQNSPSSNPLGPDTGTLHVLRGGSWYDGSDRILSANRYGDYSSGSYFNDYIFYGFRCALSATQ